MRCGGQLEPEGTGMNTKIIRRHRRRKDDGKGLRRMVAGKRFRLPADVDDREADRRFGWIEDLWLDNARFCRRAQGNCSFNIVFHAIGKMNLEINVSKKPVNTIIKTYISPPDSSKKLIRLLEIRVDPQSRIRPRTN